MRHYLSSTRQSGLSPLDTGEGLGMSGLANIFCPQVSGSAVSYGDS